jgi:preprotein translocase subunit SecB
MSETIENMPHAKFRFHNFVVKESHFVLNEQGEHKISISFNPKGYIFKSLDQFHLELGVDVKEENNRFQIRLITISVFEFDPSDDFAQYKEDFFLKNAPAIVFPYIRAYISNLTTQSGLFTIQLPTLNLLPLAESLKANLQEME